MAKMFHEIVLSWAGHVPQASGWLRFCSHLQTSLSPSLFSIPLHLSVKPILLHSPLALLLPGHWMHRSATKLRRSCAFKLTSKSLSPGRVNTGRGVWLMAGLALTLYIHTRTFELVVSVLSSRPCCVVALFVTIAMLSRGSSLPTCHFLGATKAILAFLLLPSHTPHAGPKPHSQP